MACYVRFLESFMKILFVTQYNLFDPNAGGPVFKLRSLSNYLTDLGHNVTVITVNADYEFLKKESDFLSELNNEVKIVSLRSICRFRSVTINPGIFSAAWKEIKRADVVHIFGLYDLLGPIVAFVAKMQHVPYLVEPLGMFVPIMRSFLIKRIYHFVFGTWLVDNASCVVVTSEQERQEIINERKQLGRIIVRRNGIDLNEFDDLPERGMIRNQFGISPDETMLLFLSRLSPKKNPELLIRAFAELHRQNLKLVFSGPDESGYQEELQILIKQLCVGDDIVFTGPLFGKDKVAALHDADIFVLPSNNENFGNVVAESVAIGTPVIISDRCGIAPFISDRVGLVISPTKINLVDAITYLLEDRELYLRFKKDCAKVSNDFSWDDPVSELEKVYISLTGT